MQKRRQQEEWVDSLRNRVKQHNLHYGYMASDERVERLRQQNKFENVKKAIQKEKSLEEVFHCRPCIINIIYSKKEKEK